MQQQQQQHANYDLLAVFTDESTAQTAADKLHKEGFNNEEVHQLPSGSIGSGQFREHGPRSHSEVFLQTQRAKPNPVLVALFAALFGIVLGGLTFVSTFALPSLHLPEPLSIIAGVLVGIVLGTILGLLRRGRVRGAIGQDLTPNKNKAPAPVSGARTIVALRFADPENISRKSRARAILINNQGKIDRSIGQRR